MSTAPSSRTPYVYRPEELIRLKQRRKRIMAPIFIMMMALIIAVSLVRFAPVSGSFRGLFTLVTFFSIAVTYIALATTRTIMERTHSAWANYKLVVDDQGIERVRNDTPDLRLEFSEVEVIEDTPGLGMRLNPGNALRSIFVPEAIGHYGQLRQWILQRSKAPVRVRRFVWMRSILGAIGGGITLGFVLNSFDILWVLPVASLSISFLVWVFVLIQRSPNTSQTVRNTSWAYLGLAGLCVWRLWYLSNRL